MDHHLELLILAILACVIAYSLASKAIGRTVLTLPIVFTAIGFVGAEPTVALAAPDTLRSVARIIAEVTLVLVLFADASHVRLSRLRASARYPARMLLLGLPMTIALGTLAVWIVSPASLLGVAGGGLAMALLTAALLTPTDAALGQAVVSSPDVPPRLSETINVESGLNDGLVLPFVLFGAILASTGLGAGDAQSLALGTLAQIVLGPLVGIALGWATAKLLDLAWDRDWTGEEAGALVFLATAFAAFLAAELVGGNGFIAAFVAGATFGNAFRHDIHFIEEFMEGQGRILTMLAFLIFGALLLPAGLDHMSWAALAVAVLFLTVVRMGPIWLSLAGTDLKLGDKLFLGWFGPRGIASILFTLIVLDEYELPGEEELLACVSMTVALSILLHGLSANPLASRMGRGRNEAAGATVSKL